MVNKAQTVMKNDLTQSTYRSLSIVVSGIVLATAIGLFHLEKYYVLALLIVMLLITSGGKTIRLNKKSQIIPLALWGLVYSFYSIIGDGGLVESVVYYVIAPITFYSAGNYLSKKKILQSNGVLKCIILVCTCLFIHGLLNVVVSMKNGTFAIRKEYIYDIWSHVLNNRTLIGLYLTPIVCIAIPALFVGVKPYSRITWIAAVIGLIGSLYSSILVGNRSLIIITIAMFGLCFIISGRLRNMKKYYVIGFAIVTLTIVVFEQDLFGVRSFVENSYLTQRVSEQGIISASRAVRIQEVLVNFFSYMGGWITHSSKPVTLWTHNVWLDVYMYSGLFGVVLFISYTVRVVKSSFKLARAATYPIDRLTVICLTVGILLNWASEPILIANPYYFAVCCFIFSIFENTLVTTREYQ